MTILHTKCNNFKKTKLSSIIFVTATTDFSVTVERSIVIDYSAPLSEFYNSLFIKSPAESYNYVAYLEPMHWFTWLILLVFISLAPPFLYLTTRFPKKDPVGFHDFTLGKSYVYVSSALTMRGWSNLPVKPGARVALFSLLFFGTMTYWHWEAMLISYLSTRITVLPFDNIPELIALSQYRILLVPGSSDQEDFRTSQDPDWKTAWIERVKPHLEANLGLNTANLITLLEHDADSAFYGNYFSAM